MIHPPTGNVLEKPNYKIILLVAIYRSGVINQEDNSSYIPEDLKHFNKTTKEQIVVVGRKTQETIIEKLGRPLPNRKTIILTKNKTYHCQYSDCQVISEDQVEKVLQIAKCKKVFVIGGGEIYKLFMPYATEIIASYVDLCVKGEIRFPDIDDNWEQVSVEKKHCEKSGKNFQIVKYKKKSSR